MRHNRGGELSQEPATACGLLQSVQQQLCSNSRLNLRNFSFQHLFAFLEILDRVLSLEAPANHRLSGTQSDRQNLDDILVEPYSSSL